MAGTGKKGYTGPALYGGSYNISNGIIQSGNGAASTGVANRNGAVTSASGTGNNGLSGISNVLQSATGRIANEIASVKGSGSLAAAVAGQAGTNASDYGDLIREILANQDANTAKSQAFAREQMEYQTKSDQAAMAWSAAEAQKNRDWQERLSNTAHQREVADLLVAGLNPILAANEGAYTGSGATGQGFSSSGAMGQVDTSGTAAIGSLMSTMMNTASNAAIARMYTDAERYSADLQYSASKMNTEASILNNQNTTSANKEIARAGFINDLEKVRLQGEYGLQNTALGNEGAYNVANVNQYGANTRELINQSGQNERLKQTQGFESYKQNKDLNAQMQRLRVQLANGSVTGVGAMKEMANILMDTVAGTSYSDYKNFLKNTSRSTNFSGSGASHRFGFG